MIWLYNTILYQPIYNALIFLYNVVPGHDIGLAIIALTIIIKAILFPLSAQSIKSQKSLQSLQPKMDELKKKYKDQKEKMGQEMMKLYKNNKVNPLSSCFPLLIQFPFLIAVYQVFRTGLTSNSFELLYPFITNPGAIEPMSFNLLDLSAPSIILAVLAGLAQYVQTSMLTTTKAPKQIKTGKKDENLMAEMNKSMKYFMPILTIFIGASLPAGLTLYWLVTTLLTVVQQKLIFGKKSDLATVPVNATKAEIINEPQKITDETKK